MWGILERVSTKVMEIMLIQQFFFHFCPFFLHFFQDNFQTLSPQKFVDWLTSNFMWGILGRVSTNFYGNYVYWAFFAIFSSFFQPNFQTIISSEVPGPIDSNFMWGILGRVSNKVMELMLMQQLCQHSVKAHGPLVHKFWVLCWCSNYVSIASRPMGLLFINFECCDTPEKNVAILFIFDTVIRYHVIF